MPSPGKRASSRANSLKSTGPRSRAGKARSSLNAQRHGLSARRPALPTEPDIASLLALIGLEVDDPRLALRLAERLRAYEGALGFHAKLYWEHYKPPSQYAGSDTRHGVAGMFSTEVDLLNDAIALELLFKRPRGQCDYRHVMRLVNLRLRLDRHWGKRHLAQERNRARDEVACERYLRRSSNQLVKALRALGLGLVAGVSVVGGG